MNDRIKEITAAWSSEDWAAFHARRKANNEAYRKSTTEPSVSEKACNGLMCPFCLMTDRVVHVGSNPDFRNSNNAYDCYHCGVHWEGY